MEREYVQKGVVAKTKGEDSRIISPEKRGTSADLLKIKRIEESAVTEKKFRAPEPAGHEEEEKHPAIKIQCEKVRIADEGNDEPAPEDDFKIKALKVLESPAKAENQIEESKKCLIF